MYRSTLKIFTIVLIFLVVAFIWIPLLIPCLLVINLVLLLSVSYLKISLIYGDKGEIIKPLSAAPQPPIFVSIHIPICSEPIQSVLKTIEAANAQDYDDYEVIVLYNNTNDESLIEPIKDYCSRLNNVHFYNYPVVEGFKAGALNITRQLMDNRTTHIFTLDADYILDPKGLSMAVSEFETQHVDVLQFPQSYCNHTSDNSLAAEFGHYFKVFSKSSKSYCGSLPTGTLTLVSVECIDIIGGWPQVSITEDAFLGVELLRKNCLLSYSETIIGHGKMPSSIEDLKQQRMRWIFGNFQTLIHALKHTKKLGFRGKGTLAQLTSWINLMGLPLIVIILVSLFSGVLKHTLVNSIHLLAITSILIHLITQAIVFYNAEYRGKILRLALLTNVATSVDGAFAWWGYFFSRTRPFARTNKFLCNVGSDPEATILIVAIYISSIILVYQGFYLLGFINFGLGILLVLSRIELRVSLFDANLKEKQLSL